MNYFINKTDEYHIKALDSLGWELTICNALSPADSPCRRILDEKDSYGNILYGYLSKIISWEEINKVIEIGGGYGYLMKDFLKQNPSLHGTMLDISPFLLEKQKDTLKEFKANFLLKDFFSEPETFFREYDLAVLNEIVGDFPTICNIQSMDINCNGRDTDPELAKVSYFFNQYKLEKPLISVFNFNLGAVTAVEKLCKAGIRFIFLSEHSCEANVPDDLKSIFNIIPSGNPERISLKGHDEYTIRFSHLVRIAEKLGYSVKRGQYTDFLRFTFTDEINFILRSGITKKDEHEIIRQFIEDLYKYEYLILIKK